MTAPVAIRLGFPVLFGRGIWSSSIALSCLASRSDAFFALLFEAEALEKK
jgi:hypothetical protein